MPYYKERRCAPLSTSYEEMGSQHTQRFVRDDAVSVSYRSAGPVSDLYIEVPDEVADPHAHFLKLDSDSFEQNLKSRNISTKYRSDTGHTFEAKKFRFYGDVEVPVWSLARNGSTRYSGYGHVIPKSANSIFWGPFQGQVGRPAIQPESDLSNFGQRAIAKTVPTPVEFDVGRFLGELREGLPKLGIDTFKDRAEVIKNAGGDYLNYQFGIAPLISDIKTALRVLFDSTELLKGVPEQGRPIRRKWALPPIIESEYREDTDALTQVGGYPGFDQDIPHPYLKSLTGTPRNLGVSSQNTTSKAFTAKRLERRQWFVGSYSHFLPLGFNPSNFLERLDVLTQVKLTPSTLWELAPWSWMTDWFSHIGDSIEANMIASSDTQYIHYAYAMEETICSLYTDVRFKSAPSIYVTHFAGKDRLSTVTETSFKRRIRANPFGFTAGGFNGLNDHQKSIVLALGAART